MTLKEAIKDYTEPCGAVSIYKNPFHKRVCRLNDIQISEETEKRFWDKVEKTTECWNWTAGVSYGYGIFSIRDPLYKKRKNGYPRRAHQVSLRLHGIYIDPKKVVDHICLNRKCVNPKHLRQVTSTENVFHGSGRALKNRNKTHCDSGHAFNKENTRYYFYKGRKHRACRMCHRRFTKEFREKKKHGII